MKEATSGNMDALCSIYLECWTKWYLTAIWVFIQSLTIIETPKRHMETEKGTMKRNCTRKRSQY